MRRVPSALKVEVSVVEEVCLSAVLATPKYQSQSHRLVPVLLDSTYNKCTSISKSNLRYPGLSAAFAQMVKNSEWWSPFLSEWILCGLRPNRCQPAMTKAGLESIPVLAFPSFDMKVWPPK